ncbi:uncharacterized protein B0H18DRAFT_1067370 [Fomitopsis serialis]|uniref:uncharacterized protein n=1 Tax=Fomitopsis serialis TaxID=139415 RepID=UPI0020076834|nr:uncharacterized protein B0H18DRAFT_1067370 [Neoantrodia serialis]KAH9910659.1 hypothetical protein B0H18DRAFT_1067370 [Neoantrodia serialis]
MLLLPLQCLYLLTFWPCLRAGAVGQSPGALTVGVCCVPRPCPPSRSLAVHSRARLLFVGRACVLGIRPARSRSPCV